MRAKYRLVDGNTLVVEISSELTKKMKEELSAAMEEAARKSGKIRLLIMARDYTTMNRAEALYDDLAFVKPNAPAVGRMVVVGQRSVQKTWIALFGLFGGIETEFYEESEIEAAWIWLRGD